MGNGASRPAAGGHGADIESAAMLISPLEDAYAESMYEGDTIGMARKLNVMPWAVETFRERLHDNPSLAVRTDERKAS